VDAAQGTAELVMLSVAIVGAGGIGHIRAKSILDSQQGCVSWVADVDAGRAQELAVLCSATATVEWRQAVSNSDVDAVIISTPTKFHAEIAIRALEAGKHVLCEKPLARTVEEAHGIVEAARRAGRVLKTGFNYRQMGHVRKAQELLRSGAIGPPYFLRCRYGHGGRSGYEKHWCTDVDLSGGGVLQEQGIHMVDLVRVLLGKPVKVMAETPRYFWNFPEVEDNCFCLFETAAGRLAQIHVSWTQWKNVLEIEIFGHDGYLRLEGRDGHYGPQRLTWGKRQPTHGRPVEEAFTFEEAESSWDREWCEFVELIRDGKGSMDVARQGLETQQLIEAAYRSAREHAWIEISTCQREKP
jgi:predicted dehydrogenase